MQGNIQNNEPHGGMICTPLEMNNRITARFGSVERMLHTAPRITLIVNQLGRFWLLEENQTEAEKFTLENKIRNAKEIEPVNEIMTFNYQDKEVRTVQVEDTTWWVLKDVCDALELSNSRVVADRLDADDVSQTYVIDSMGRNQETTIINESGLYNVILRSDKPEAKTFKRWVTHEVLPAIRQHGGYLTPAKIEEVLLNPDTIIALATNLKAAQHEVKHLEGQVAQRDQIIGELKPKADYVDWILQNPGLVTITQIAKDYGMSGKAMNAMLRNLKVQYKQSGQWLLYAKYHSMGYTHSETFAFKRSDGVEDSTMETKWTQKGRLFIYELLKKKMDVYPVIEQG